MAVLAAITYSWNLGGAGYNTFYSSAARSMQMSWRAFWFGALDPGAHVTLDKLSGFLIPQALSVRMFGFHPWSIALPQVIEGTITVLAIYVIGRRWRGRAVGLLAAFVAAVTPLFASMFGHGMEDCLLTMSLALAVLCWQSALLRGRVSSMLFAGLWIGIGFQAKMMQAWVVLPGLLLGLLLVLGFSRWRRLLALLGLLASTAVASLLWMTIIQLIPAHRRPFIDGTSNNNIFTMVFGYNGFNRIIPNFLPHVLTNIQAKSQLPVLSILQHPRRLPPVAMPTGLEHNKLFLPYYATQIGWVYPAAVAGVVVEIILFRRLVEQRLDLRWQRRQQQAADESPDGANTVRIVPTGAAEATTVALVCWLVLAAGLLSFSQVPHVAYLASTGVQLALLAAAGLVALARRYRSRFGLTSFAFPTLVIASALWGGYLVRAGHAAPIRLAWIILIGGALAAGLLIVGRLIAERSGSHQRRLLRTATIVGLVAVLLGPTLWTGYVFDRSADGSANEAYTGPRPNRHQSYQITNPFIAQAELRLNANQRKLLDILQRSGDAKTTLLTDNWTIAATFLLSARVQVTNMGGYSGTAPTPTLAQLQRLIATGVVRYALLLGATLPVRLRNTTVGTDDDWIRSHCSQIDNIGLMDPAMVPHRPIDVYRCDLSSLSAHSVHQPAQHRPAPKHSHHKSTHRSGQLPPRTKPRPTPTGSTPKRA